MSFFVFFFKQKTAYEMRISDWSSDVCSSDLVGKRRRLAFRGQRIGRRVPAACIVVHLRTHVSDRLRREVVAGNVAGVVLGVGRIEVALLDRADRQSVV